MNTSLLGVPGDSSVKWSVPPGWIGAGIAESDFGTAPAVVEALHAAVSAQSLTYLSERVAREATEACSGFLADRYGWPVLPSEIRLVPDVVGALRLVLKHFVSAGAPIIVPTPAYMPFLQVPRQDGHPIIEVPSIVDEAGRAVLDLEAVAAAFDRGAELLVLCNPHNPMGSTMEATELAAVRDVVEAAGARVFSDEIHAPLVYAGRAHLPYASLDAVTARHTITATSISKGWNAPGLKCAQVILTSESDREYWDREDVCPRQGGSMLGAVAARAAYLDGVEWLDEVLGRFDRNRALLATAIGEQLPGVRWRAPEATYLAWLDFGAYDLGMAPAEFLSTSAKVMTTPGSFCGVGFDDYVRFNFAMPAEMVTECVERMARSLGSLS